MTTDKPNILDNILKPSAISKNSPAVDTSTTTTIKSQDYENWNTKPDDNIFNPNDFYDDVLTEESMQEEVAQATFRNLLQPSELLKKKIGEYVKSKNLQNISTNEYTPFQTFTFEGQRYLLDHDVDVAYIQAMILDMSNHTILEHTLNKRPNTLYKDLMEALENKKEVFENMMVTNKLPIHVVFKLIIRVFSKMINDKLVRQRETKFEFNLKYTAEKLGELIFDAIIYYNFIYDISAEPIDDDEKRDKKVKEFVKRDLEYIYKELTKIKLALPSKSKIDFELYNVILISLENYLENLSFDFIRDKSKEDSQVELIKYQIKLGLKIVDILVDANILQHFIDNRKVPQVRFVHDTTIQLFASASFYKPRITFGKYASVYKIDRGEHITTEIDLKQELVRNNKGVKIQASKELYKILEDHAQTLYAIDAKQFDDFIKILEHMFLAKEKTIDLLLPFLNRYL